jgi:hypothetical protein
MSTTFMTAEKLPFTSESVTEGHLGRSPGCLSRAGSSISSGMRSSDENWIRDAARGDHNPSAVEL